MKKILLFALIVAAFMSCSSLKITVNMDGKLDFDSFKTYSYFGWDSASTHINKYYQREIEYSFADEFGKRGMTYDQSGNGDVVVSLFLVIDVENSTRAYSNYYGHSSYGFHQPAWGWGYGYGYGATYGHPYSYGGVVYEENTYYTGTLVCDVFHRETKDLAWQGVASKAIDPGSRSKAENIKKVISRLMANYPVEKPKEKK